MKTTTTTHLADEFKDSPRYKAIRSVFEAIDALTEDEPVNVILAKMNRTGANLNGEERYQLPLLVRQALKLRGRSVQGLG